ncbi:DUF397 domain-containing protein [Streptomyces sp. NPDC007983]|uniref:DUF397 domain-containing protein n=1 Tax=Streptomyces sp. NPDC007983 TaxID=3364800 RepID=UPI0036EE2B01
MTWSIRASGKPAGKLDAIAATAGGGWAVRDSKDLDRPPLYFTGEGWQAFLLGIERGAFEGQEQRKRRGPPAAAGGPRRVNGQGITRLRPDPGRTRRSRRSGMLRRFSRGTWSWPLALRRVLAGRRRRTLRRQARRSSAHRRSAG